MTTAVTRPQLSHAIAELVPNIIRGVQLDFFLRGGVTQTQLLVLLSVHAARQATMSELAGSLHVTMPTVTGIVTRLVRAGHLQRVSSPVDRRQVVVRLTGKGASFIRAFQAVIRRRWDDVLRSLSAQERDAFYRVVTKLATHLQPQFEP